MKYKAHIIKPNKETSIPQDLIFFDTEAYLTKISEKETEHRLRLCVACYVKLDQQANVIREEYQHFYEHNRFFSYIQNKLENLSKIYLFAHNLWYDLRLTKLLEIACNNKFEIQHFLNKQRVLYIKLTRKKKAIECIDTTNFFPFSVSYLGKYLNKPKLSINFNNCTDQELLVYCKRDVEIIKDMMINYLRFIVDNDLGKFAVSLASQAFNAFTHRFMKHKIHVHHQKPVVDLERSAYFGGRTECFRIGKIPAKKVYYLDVNSMYPFVMKTKPVPVKLETYTDKPLQKNIKDIVNSMCCIAEVTIKTDKPYYPYRYKNKLVFPTGGFKTSLCTESLRLAIKNNHLEKVHRIAVYRSDVIFADYVDFFFALKDHAKKKQDKVYYLLSKLFLNALYGKFGQRIDDIVDIQKTDIIKFERYEIYDADTDEHFVINHLANKIFTLKLNSSDSYNTFVAIPAHITDYARNVLLNYIEIAKFDNVYYCDTDSLFTNEAGYKNLKDYIDPNKLGKLDLEGIYKEVYLYGAKDYKLDKEIKLKGIPKSAIKIDDITYEYEQFPRPLSDLRKSLDKPYTTERRVKKLNRTYDKGIVTSSGRVKPLVINEEN